MKLYLILVLLIAGKLGLCQKQKSQFTEGVYSGGICMDGAICGYWLVKADSSFIFADFEGNNIKKTGVGDWHLLNDSLIKFIFRNNPLSILEKAQITYFSETSGSFDSVYITGQLKNKKKEGIGYASIIFSKKYEAVTDVTGNFKIIFPRNHQITTVTIIKKDLGYMPLEFDLSPYNNFHKLNIELPLIDSSTCMSVYNTNPLISFVDSLTIKIDRSNGKKRARLSIAFITSDKQFIISKLMVAKESQQYLKSNINELIELIKK